MGICSKAKEVICCNKMTDIPILQDINNNSFDSKKMITKNNIKDNNEINIDNKESLKEKSKKFFGSVKVEEKNQEIKEMKKFLETDIRNLEKNGKKDTERKKVKFRTLINNGIYTNEQDNNKIDKNKDIINEFRNNENDETDNAENNNKENCNKSNNYSEHQDLKNDKEKRRGKSVHVKKNSISKEVIHKELPKFTRNRKKSATLMGNAFKFAEKLHMMEKKIPVMYETLISKNVGNPDIYYKKLKDLGSGSYGTVYMARNTVTDNIVAIKIIEKVQDNMIDDMEIQNEINILKTLSHPNIVKIY